MEDGAVVTIAIIALALILYLIGVIGALSHKVITATFIFIMSYGLTKIVVGVLGDLHIPLEQMTLFWAMLASCLTDFTI